MQSVLLFVMSNMPYDSREACVCAYRSQRQRFVNHHHMITSGFVLYAIIFGGGTIDFSEQTDAYRPVNVTLHVCVC